MYMYGYVYLHVHVPFSIATSYTKNNTRCVIIWLPIDIYKD